MVVFFSQCRVALQLGKAESNVCVSLFQGRWFNAELTVLSFQYCLGTMFSPHLPKTDQLESGLICLALGVNECMSECGAS